MYQNITDTSINDTFVCQNSYQLAPIDNTLFIVQPIAGMLIKGAVF